MASVDIRESKFAGCLEDDDSKPIADDTSPLARNMSERGRDCDDDDGPTSVLLDYRHNPPHDVFVSYK